MPSDMRAEEEGKQEAEETVKSLLAMNSLRLGAFALSLIYQTDFEVEIESS
jgi:hypothetical protein